MPYVALCLGAICASTHVSATENLDFDNKHFRSALIDTQRSMQEKVEKLSKELQVVNHKREQLQEAIQKIQQESASRIDNLQTQIDEKTQKTDALTRELLKAREENQLKIQSLASELKKARQESQLVKQQLLQARSGQTDQIVSLESELKTSHEKLQKLRADLIDAKSVNSKQLKQFTAWLYTAKEEAKDLQKELAILQTQQRAELVGLQKQLKASQDNSTQLQVALCETKQQHKDEMLEMKAQLLIAQNASEVTQHVNAKMAQEAQVICCQDPVPAIYCYRPNVSEPTSWARGEVLVWTVETSDLDFVIPSAPQPGATATGQIGRVEEAKFNWCPEFRFELGHRFRPDFWELSMTYTYLDVDGSDTFDVSSTSIMQPTQNSTSVQRTRLAKSDVDFFYNVIDLMLSRSFLPSKQLIVCPKMGLTGSWMDRDFDVKYTGIGSPENKVHGQNTWEFHGGGMRVGVDVDWYFGSGFSLSGKTSLAALIGYYKNTYKSQTNNATTVNPPATIENARYDDQRIATHIQMQLGPMWGKVWDNMGFSAFVGYEINAWFNVEEVRSGLNQDTSSTTSRRTLINNSTLGMQGFVGKLQVNF